MYVIRILGILQNGSPHPTLPRHSGFDYIINFQLDALTVQDSKGWRSVVFSKMKCLRKFRALAAKP